VILVLGEHVRIHESTLQIKEDPRGTNSRKRRLLHQFSGSALRRSRGDMVDKTQIIDRENDRYLEHVVDPTTGEIIRHCDEPLTQHHNAMERRATASPDD
jgi:hypothetical protein